MGIEQCEGPYCINEVDTMQTEYIVLFARTHEVGSPGWEDERHLFCSWACYEQWHTQRHSVL